MTLSTQRITEESSEVSAVGNCQQDITLKSLIQWYSKVFFSPLPILTDLPSYTKNPGISLRCKSDSKANFKSKASEPIK